MWSTSISIKPTCASLLHLTVKLGNCWKRNSETLALRIVLDTLVIAMLLLTDCIALSVALHVATICECWTSNGVEGSSLMLWLYSLTNLQPLHRWKTWIYLLAHFLLTPRSTSRSYLLLMLLVVWPGMSFSESISPQSLCLNSQRFFKIFTSSSKNTQLGCMKKKRCMWYKNSSSCTWWMLVWKQRAKILDRTRWKGCTAVNTLTGCWRSSGRAEKTRWAPPLL